MCHYRNTINILYIGLDVDIKQEFLFENGLLMVGIHWTQMYADKISVHLR